MRRGDEVKRRREEEVKRRGGKEERRKGGKEKRRKGGEEEESWFWRRLGGESVLALRVLEIPAVGCLKEESLCVTLLSHSNSFSTEFNNFQGRRDKRYKKNRGEEESRREGEEEGKRGGEDINSSLNGNFLIMEVFRFHKIVLIIWCFPNALRGLVSMSSSKCDQV